MAASAGPLISERQALWTTLDKAFFADEKTVDFVRPGLKLTILSARIEADGTIRTRIRITDPQGLGLDRLGINTPGLVNVSFIAARIPKDATQYVSYTTRTQTSPITNKSAIQAGTDTNGAWSPQGNGEYEYTFGTKLPANYDKTVTHTIAAYGNRNLSEFDLGIALADTVFHFVPDGSAVKTTRDVIKTATCNKCHDQLSAHGTTGRRSVEVCVTCHQPQTTDPDTGRSVDLVEMVHKIHMGENLPSVKAGQKYIIIGNAQSVNDFSDIAFPTEPNNCEACHEQGKGAAQEMAWLNPSRQACGSCHDNVNFATGENHNNLPQVSDSQCSRCHVPQGELEFDASIRGAHTRPRFSRDLPGTVFEINEVRAAPAGGKPTVTFTVKDKRGQPIKASEMTRLALVLGGPTTDYKWTISEDARAASGGTDGRYTYTFSGALPADAKGTYAVGIEGYRNMTLLAGTKQERTVRDAGVNKVAYFSTDSSKVAPRRTVVALDKCNGCHSSLSVHGDNRNNTEFCVVCHNPLATDAAQRPAAQMPAQGIDFRTMIHRIHTGKELTMDFTIYGFGGSRNNFNEVGFPGDRRNCSMCHVGGSEQLPAKAGTIDVMDPKGPLSPMGPITAACTGCHTDVSTASHALINTSRLGESCATCHGPSADFSVSREHAR
ncbi:MAG: OmcA/MtrC family decaheme c-type cytochrome [Bryobacteraceae bacterium]